jgi:hypothetical protein
MTVAGAPQGSAVQAARGAPLTAHMELSVQAPLAVLEIVATGGRVAWSAPDLEREVDVELEADLGAADEASYYYLRARQEDGALIYASPVFVEVGERQ